MKIYTRTGDRGQTSLYGGVRVFKNNIRVEAYGALDELNSFLGVSIAKIKEKKISDFLTGIQEDLFLIGSSLAGAKTDLSVLKSKTTKIENMIDWADAQLPTLKNFILPAGSWGAASLFYARAVARRCERAIVTLNQKEPVDKNLLIYMNRLSDLLFQLARLVNFKDGVKEKIWKRNSVHRLQRLRSIAGR